MTWIRRQLRRPPITLIAVVATGIFPGASAFWMRFIWKNGLVGPRAVFEGSSGLVLYLLTGETPLLSDTFKFPEGATQCQLMQDLTVDNHGPADPIPGMIGIVDSPRVGLKVEYLLFFEDEVCGTRPAMFLKLRASRENQSPTGNYYFVNILDHAVPAVKSWKQADPDDPIDRGVIETWDPSAQRNRERTHPSRLFVNIAEQGGFMRWKHLISDEKLGPSTVLKNDSQIEGSLGAHLMQPFAVWLKKEEEYEKQQSELNTDFGSEDFNFIPTNDFTLGSQRIGAYMIQEEYRRLGLPVPQIKAQTGQAPESRQRPDQPASTDSQTITQNAQTVVLPEQEVPQQANLPNQEYPNANDYVASLTGYSGFDPLNPQRSEYLSQIPSSFQQPTYDYDPFRLQQNPNTNNNPSRQQQLGGGRGYPQDGHHPNRPPT
ncbi:hypothetical protein TWF730_004502 [Orbilia blumenaviensis]|uniref:Uncharacterized protein n=1 Tax=Orbilia blumenaviensis TaxID=1796055 RepID=A0AAV9U1X0_9PEZI